MAGGSDDFWRQVVFVIGLVAFAVVGGAIFAGVLLALGLAG